MNHSPSYGKPRQFNHASNKIAEGLEAIATGQSSGEYPALDKLFRSSYPKNKKVVDYGYRGEICTPECPNRTLIQDVSPPLGERVAVVEHIATELNKEFDRHREESIRAGLLYATKEELAVVDGHVDKLDNQNTTKTMILVVTVIGLLLSIAYNVINIYKNFHL